MLLQKCKDVNRFQVFRLVNKLETQQSEIRCVKKGEVEKEIGIPTGPRFPQHIVRAQSLLLAPKTDGRKLGSCFRTTVPFLSVPFLSSVSCEFLKGGGKEVKQTILLHH